MKIINTLITLILLIILNIISFAQTGFYEPINVDTFKWSYEDFGRMWTFDNVPVERFENEYGFNPSQEWLNDVQESALQFGWGCSAAFVSENGLIMTNHHCGRDQLYTIQKKGEDLLKNGFYAKTLEEERKLKDLYVDQLVFIKDKTDEIKNFMNRGITDNEKINLKKEIIDSLENKSSDETGLHCKVVTLYNGSKYSLYGYKRYNDIRLVMAPDFQIAATGWDWDNFTYPRYELDFMFYRAYDENGKPVKVNHYFKWSKNGAKEGEPIFVVGRPGRTERLLSFSELKYLKDFIYPKYLIGFNSIYYAYNNMYQRHPERYELLNLVMRWGNSRKSYAGRLSALNNDIIMKKKKDFENDLKEQVHSSRELNEKYGEVWNSIDIVLKELSNYSKQNSIVRISRFLKPVYLQIASDLVLLAEQKLLPNDERFEKYKNENIDSTIVQIFPDSIDAELQINLLNAHEDFLTKILGSNDSLVKVLYPSKNIDLEKLISDSKLSSIEGVKRIAKMTGDQILNYSDPFIQFILELNKISETIKPKLTELNNTLDVLNQSLGEVIGIVYENKIPPDATGTLRISDGVIKGYEYNGTIAPGKTTFYGLWDRYFSFNQKTYPWGLHERWKKPPKQLDLSINVGFASTNDIVGGNSGSSIINTNKEIIGLVHDGNIESLAGYAIFLPENNRTVATDSKGLIEALKYVYKTNRLVKELQNGQIE